MRSINWIEQLINLLVVIVGVSIAFSLDGWRETRKARELEFKYLEDLSEDLAYDTELLDTLIIIDSMTMEKINFILDQAAESPRANVGSEAIELIYSLPFSSKSVTFETIKEAGKLDLFSSYEVQNSVVFLYDQVYRGNATWDATVQRHIDDFIKPLTISSVTIRSDFISSTLLRNQEYINSLIIMKQILAQRLNFRKLTRDHVGLVTNAIEAQLERMS